MRATSNERFFCLLFCFISFRHQHIYQSSFIIQGPKWKRATFPICIVEVVVSSVLYEQTNPLSRQCRGFRILQRSNTSPNYRQLLRQNTYIVQDFDFARATQTSSTQNLLTHVVFIQFSIRVDIRLHRSIIYCISSSLILYKTSNNSAKISLAAILHSQRQTYVRADEHTRADMARVFRLNLIFAIPLSRIGELSRFLTF